MNPNDELNLLGYANSAPDLVPVDETHPKDEAEVSTLVEVLDLIQNRKAYYLSIESLTLEDKNLTVVEQLAVNKKVLFHIQELESKISSVIKRVEDKLNGR